jgi:hypothetical protein
LTQTFLVALLQKGERLSVAQRKEIGDTDKSNLIRLRIILNDLGRDIATELLAKQGLEVLCKRDVFLCLRDNLP